MASLAKRYEQVCSEAGKENVNQPYVWLGIQDIGGHGQWQEKRSHKRLVYQNWDEDEGSEGDTCARIQGNGSIIFLYAGHLSTFLYDLLKPDVIE